MNYGDNEGRQVKEKGHEKRFGLVKSSTVPPGSISCTFNWYLKSVNGDYSVVVKKKHL